MSELFDIVVRRQIYIEGLKASKGIEFAGTLAKLRTELAYRLSGFEYNDLGSATRTALKRLIVDLRKIAKAIFDPYLAALIDWLQRFVKIDLGLLGGIYRSAEPQAAERLDTAKDSDSMWALAIGLPMAATGTLALSFLNALLPSTYVKFERLTLQHYANRSTKEELINAIVGNPNSKDMQGYLRQLNAQGNAATNTVIQHLSAQVNENLSDKITDLYQWISVLDDHTTKICISRAGNIYRYGKGPVPPAHVGCRSTTAPYHAGGDREHGSFSDWLKRQSDEFVDDALDGRRGARYERTSAISLAEYAAKAPLIGA